jgi:Putative adhesin
MKTNLLLGAVFAGALLATPAAAQESTTWNWKGTLGSGRTVYLRNVNGAVRFEQGSGNTVEVRAEKRWRRGDPDDVRIEARQGANGGDIIICAFWNERATCDEDGYQSNGSNNRWNDRNDVSVHFVVRVPANARVNASTVNGEMVVDGTSGDVEASTVNGDVEARSTEGRVEAETVNGSITVRTSMKNREDLEYSTVNGSITIEMEEGANADVDLTTVNGRVSSDFPLTLDGRINPRKIRAKMGSGGARLRASTVNGSIRLRKL